MRLIPKNSYVTALLLAGTVVAAAWVSRGSYQMVGPGAEAPAFEVATLSGEPASLADYAGKVILLNVWATWCPPCKEEMPSMERLYRYFQERGSDFEILAVSIDKAQGQADANGNEGGDLVAFVEEFDLTFTILHNPSGDIQRIYQTTGVPESFIIARDGTIYHRLAGAANWDTPKYKDLIQRLLDEGGPLERRIRLTPPDTEPDRPGGSAN